MPKNLQFPFSCLLVLYVTCESAFLSRSFTLALDIKLENNRNNTIFADHLLWSFESSSLLHCAKECAENEECLAFSHWKNASESLLTCRGHTAPSGFLSIGEDAQGARLYSVVGRAEPVSAADFVMFSDQAKKGWNPAREHCESMGMTLATLDQEANDYLAGVAYQDWYKTHANSDFWVGLFDASILDQTSAASGYRWVDDCSSLADSSWVGWESGSPQSTNDHLCVCAAKDSVEWRTMMCDLPLQFLCQKPKSVCDNVALGYDAVNRIHRSPCFSFQFALTSMPEETGPLIPEVWCPADNVPSSAADFVMFSDQAKKGWNPAKQHCESVGMTLATLDQPATAYLASLRLLDWKTDFWMGLFDATITDQTSAPIGYRWVDDCSSLADSSWVGWASAACDNVDLGYDAVNKIYRSPCFSFQFDMTVMADDAGSTTPAVSCPAITCPSPPSVSETQYSPVKVTYYVNDEVTYYCNSEQEGGGDGLRVCKIGGTWVQQNPDPNCA
ncbi:hypothetical protein BaRGS_00011423 [Batillaria attramentaria]|uniref:C-type lectin n=1 Tax=Batillaria attramentaria TaxID=370345 RepID=A0ABD0LEC9_9CAEN